jgi:hypothetical protein
MTKSVNVCFSLMPNSTDPSTERFRRAVNTVCAELLDEPLPVTFEESWVCFTGNWSSEEMNEFYIQLWLEYGTEEDLKRYHELNKEIEQAELKVQQWVEKGWTGFTDLSPMLFLSYNYNETCLYEKALFKQKASPELKEHLLWFRLMDQAIALLTVDTKGRGFWNGERWKWLRETTNNYHHFENDRMEVYTSYTAGRWSFQIESKEAVIHLIVDGDSQTFHPNIGWNTIQGNKWEALQLLAEFGNLTQETLIPLRQTSPPHNSDEQQKMLQTLNEWAEDKWELFASQRNTEGKKIFLWANLNGDLLITNALQQSKGKFKPDSLLWEGRSRNEATTVYTNMMYKKT